MYGRLLFAYDLQHHASKTVLHVGRRVAQAFDGVFKPFGNAGQSMPILSKSHSISLLGPVLREVSFTVIWKESGAKSKEVR
ncbi:hypothetical protein ABAC402_08340 [Asticcacaulis sp. AC402]|nr:hypothetical protein ABAC402_08340 [Asticcacaulis sp. AC402]